MSLPLKIWLSGILTCPFKYLLQQFWWTPASKHSMCMQIMLKTKEVFEILGHIQSLLSYNVFL